MGALGRAGSGNLWARSGPHHLSAPTRPGSRRIGLWAGPHVCKSSSGGFLLDLQCLSRDPLTPQGLRPGLLTASWGQEGRDSKGRDSHD